MAYVAKGNYGYGDGLNADVENPTGQINSYANVTAYTAATITIGAPSNGIYEKFTADNEIMIHVSATNGSSQEFGYLGRYIVAKIKTVSGSVLTIDTDFTQILPTTEFAKYQVQAITIAKFKNLTLATSTITPPAYNISSRYGGILLAKCKEQISFSGGNINLVDKGIPVANVAYRPLTVQEQAGKGNADTDKFSAFENHITIREFLLNAGDGAAMIWAKKFVQSGTGSRIGGTTPGVQFGRGNKGGSTIALVCGDIQGFDPSIISKTKNSGQGLGRCYIASKTKLRNDEGLYAYDCISDPLRVMRDLNIKNYGDGGLGDVTNPTLPMNNYARVVSISSDGKTIAYNNKTINGMAQICKSSTIMFHVSKHIDSADMNLLGKFMLAKVLSDDGNNLVLDTPVTKVFDASKLSKYSCQIISLAQFNNLTISADYNKTIGWNDSTKVGGICAIASKGICNIEDGKINVEGKGGGTAYGREGLGFIGNAQMADILPLGQGHGSVFLLANNTKANENSRIGATYDGSKFGGDSGNSHNGGGYFGTNGNYGSGGGGSAGGKGRKIDDKEWGGYGSNSISGEKQGAHIFLATNKINYFNLAIISTGGNGGLTPYEYNLVGYPGGAGYGGGGTSNIAVTGTHYTGGGAGYNGGGSGTNGNGGSSGWAFFYINIIEEFDETGLIAA